MKRRFLFATLLMVAAIMVAVVSCKKETQNNEKTENNTVFASAEIVDMDEYLISFKEKLLSAQKGEEFISLKQASCDLGNLLNFDFDDAGRPISVLQVDTIYAKLILLNGQVDLSQLAVTYKDVVDQIKQVYNQSTLPDKSIFSVYCAIHQNAKDGETGDVKLVLTTRGGIPVPLKTSMDSTDCWFVGNLQGHCDNTNVGDDHSTILCKVYNNSKPVLSCEGRIYYTNIGLDQLDAMDYPEADPTINYNMGYKLWVGIDEEVEQGTVSPEEMAYYFDNLCQFVDNWVLPGNDYCIMHTFGSINRLSNNFPYPYGINQFRCNIQYGQFHCSPNSN